LEALNKRIQILEGFETIFDALDEILKIVRKSEARPMRPRRSWRGSSSTPSRPTPSSNSRSTASPARDSRDPAGTGGKAQAREGDWRLLKREADLWKIVRDEIEAIQKKYGDARRSEIVGEAPVEDYTDEDFIIEEDNVVVITRDGWVKRQKEIKDIGSTRLREGDAVLAVLPAARERPPCFFTNFGVAYTARITDVPASTGYGEPIQSLFKFKDGEKVVGALSLDPRAVGVISAGTRRRRRRPHALAVSSDGYSLRFSLQNFLRAQHPGCRKFARVADGAEIVGVVVSPATNGHRRHSPGPPMLCKATRSTSSAPGPRRHPDQAAEGGRPPARLHRLHG